MAFLHPKNLDEITRDKIRNVMDTIADNCIDGHFWIELDGQVIDPYFKEYNLIKKIYDAYSITHLPADDIIQKIIIGMYERFVLKHFNTLDEFSVAIDKLFEGKPELGFCYQNAIINKKKLGGNLVFGSLGFVKADGSVHYEYGGENWKVKDFFRK